jgi:RNA-directed DNA polymerase
VNKGPNVSRREFDRLKAVLTNCVRHGAASQNRKEHDDFKAHLEGKVAFVAMVRPKRAAKLRALLERIVWP